MTIRTSIRAALLSATTLALAAYALPAAADPTAPCNVGPVPETPECGVDAPATAIGATATGDTATAAGAQSTVNGNNAAALGAGGLAINFTSEARARSAPCRSAAMVTATATVRLPTAPTR